MTSQAAPGDNPGKFQDIVKRRIKRGQFYHPALLQAPGVSSPFPLVSESYPPARRRLLGSAIWAGSCGIWTIQIRRISAPLFFRGTLRTGCWRCPPGTSGEVRG